MDLTCKDCGAAIDAANTHLDGRLAECPACQRALDAPPHLGHVEAEAPLDWIRPRVPMPEGISIVEDAGGERAPGSYRHGPGGPGRLVIVLRWISGNFLGLLVICFGLDLLGLLTWRGDIVVEGSVFAGSVMLVAAAFLNYALIARLLNRTWIIADRGKLTIRHAPVPWATTRTIQVADLAQLFCKKVVMQGTDGAPDTFTYTLAAVTTNGEQIDLVDDLPEVDQALFLEQRLEERLGIADVPVAGEVLG
ncbi:MAG: hypothetical protein U0359_34700 [Byssovorax sp.]